MHVPRMEGQKFQSHHLSPPNANSLMEFCDPKMTLAYILDFFFLNHKRTISAKNFEVVIFILKIR